MRPFTGPDAPYKVGENESTAANDLLTLPLSSFPSPLVPWPFSLALFRLFTVGYVRTRILRSISTGSKTRRKTNERTLRWL